MAGKYTIYDPEPSPSAPPPAQPESKYKTYDLNDGVTGADPMIKALTAPGYHKSLDEAAVKARVDQNVANAQIMETLKGRGDYDSEATFEDVNGKWSLFDLNRSNENTEQFKKFKAKWPKGDLMWIPTDSGTVPVARTSPKEPYRQLGNWGTVEAAVVSPQTAAAVVAGVMTGGMSLPIAIGSQFLAGAAGSVLDNSIESARGYQDSSLGSMAGDAAYDATVGAAMEPVGRWATGAMGYGKEAVLNSFKDLAAAGKEIPILKGQVGNPIKTGLFKFISAVSPTAKYALRQQRSLIKDLVESETQFTPEMLASMSDRELANYLQLYGSDIVLSKFGTLNAAEKYAVGKNLMRAIERFKKVSTAANDALYEKALAQGQGEVWDPRPLQAFAKEQLQPVVGRADAGGKMGEGVYGDVELSAPLNKELSSIYEAIVALDPSGMALHKGHSGIKQLMTLRTRVGDLLQQELPTEQERGVRKLYGMLTDTIENPATGNEAFVKSWQEANAAYRETQNFLQYGQVKAALINGTAPEKIVNKVFKPDNLEFMQTLKRNLTADPDTAEVWTQLTDRFREQLLANNDKLASADKFLSKYEKPELDLLMSPRDQQLIKLASIQAQQIKSGPVAGMLKEFSSDGERILSFVKEGNEAEIKRMVDMAGGPKSDTAAALRAGVFQKLLRASSYADEDTGMEMVNPKLLSKALKELRTSGRLNVLFSPDDWRRFGDWEKVGAVIGNSGDKGASLQVGAISGELAQTPIHMMENPAQLAYLPLRLGFMDTLGYVLSRPESFQKVLAAGENMDRKRRDAMLINTTGRILADVRKTWLNRENLGPMEEADRKMTVIKEDPGLWEYLKGYFGSQFDPNKMPSNTPAPPQPPEPIPVVPQQQGSLQPSPRTGIMTTNMAQTMPPRPAPAMAQPSPAQGSKYAALFPNDSLGTLAASGGIASLTG